MESGENADDSAHRLAHLPLGALVEEIVLIAVSHPQVLTHETCPGLNVIQRRYLALKGELSAREHVYYDKQRGYDRPAVC